MPDSTTAHPTVGCRDVWILLETQVHKEIVPGASFDVSIHEGVVQERRHHPRSSVEQNLWASCQNPESALTERGGVGVLAPAIDRIKDLAVCLDRVEGLRRNANECDVRNSYVGLGQGGQIVWAKSPKNSSIQMVRLGSHEKRERSGVFDHLPYMSIGQDTRHRLYRYQRP